MNRNRALSAVGIVALALLAVGGSGLALGDGPGMSLLGDDESVAPENVTLSEQEAIDIATAEANGTVEEVELESEDGTPAYEVELVTTDGAETEVTVHADDGTVIEAESENEANEMEEDDEHEDDETEDEHEDNETEDEHEDNETEDEYDDEMEDGYEDNETGDEYEEEHVAPENVSLSEEEAIDVATAEADGTVEEVELESEDGTPAYEVELVTADGTETEVTVHADDGAVLETETGDE